MKIFKRVISVLLVLALFVGSFIGSYVLFDDGTREFNVERLSLFDEAADCYYLQNAPHDIVFSLDAAGVDKISAYTLVDSAGHAVPTVYKRSLSGGGYDIVPLSEGYTPGERYTLTLGPDVAFADDNLKKARSLVFCIEKEAVEEYAFTENVTQITGTIQNLSENTISLDGITASLGDIIIGQNEENEYVAYKIDEIPDGTTANVSVPAVDEIYSDLNVYGEYVFDVDDLVLNPDLEVEIIQNVRNSSFYSGLITAAYASDVPSDGALDVSIAPDRKTNTLEITIKITLKAGENGLFGIGELRDHEVAVTLKSTLGLKVNPNIQNVTNWDISGTITSGFSWQVELTRTGILDKEWESGLDGLFMEKDKYASYDDYYLRKEYQQNIKKITDTLNQIAADATAGEIKIFDWNLPIPSVPGLYFSAEVKLFAKFEMTANITIGQESTTQYTVGVLFTGGKFDTYSNTYRSKEDVSLSLQGKASAKAGVKLVIGATLVNEKVANVRVDPQVGLYADVYVTVPILGADKATADRFVYSYFEPGVYFSATVTAHLNLVVKQYDFNYELVEKKFPIEAWTLGNAKIAIGIVSNAASVRAVNNVVAIPNIIFEYYDVKKGVNSSEVLSYGDLKFVTNDGTQLKASDGKLTLPAATASGSTYITATYLHTDGKTYSTIFRVLITGSILEGKVSAYTDNLSSGALEGALVELYTASNSAAPVGTQRTDGDGRFSFNVAEGSYRIVVSADGYRTLTSSQQVGPNEIKYTEHMLLMDDRQTGTGTAGGTVSNALNGRGVSGAQIRLRTNWNNTTGAYVDGFETVTNSSGRYTVTDVPVGYYTVEASLDGYVTGYTNIIVLSENAKTDFDFTITPELADDEIRIVLTWGASPSDLDSHLIGRTPDNGTFNVYYSNKVYRYNGVEMANLDVDDTSSYGPETITILGDIYGVYTYAVHNFSNRSSTNSTALSYSGAVVRVFIGSYQVAEYHVPTDQVGTYWTVFQIDGAGNIMPVNTLSNTKPSAQEG